MTKNQPDTYSFTRYLAAKKSVDDRALNASVWRTFWEVLPASSRQHPVRILELGAGIGSMVERIVERNLLNHAHYTAIDASAENIQHFAGRLEAWAAEKPFFTVIPQAVDLFDFLKQHSESRWQVLLAHAFLDLVDLATTLPALFNVLKPEGLFYFTLNFDGDTILEPVIEPDFDHLIVQLYHQTMDARVVNGRPAGHSLTGRRLFTALRAGGAEILAAGSSDWVVYAQDGCYPQDEAYFLHHILHFFETSLTGHPDLDQARLARWLEKRHAQIERGELVYIAHQLDFVGRVPEPGAAVP